MSDCFDFAERKFHLECSSLQFERQGQQPLKFRGPGHISQTNDGQLEYVAHVDAEVAQRIEDIKKSASSRPSGTILKDENYFKLEITSYSGPSWRAMVAEPNLRTGLSGPGIAYGSVHEIRREHQLPGEELGDYAFLFLPNRIDFPTNSTTQTLVLRNQIERNNTSAHDCAVFRIGQEEFLIYNNGLHAVIECTLEKGSIGINRHLRIREALEFALAQLIIPCAFELISGNKMKTILRSSAFGPDWKNKQHPPLRFDNVPLRPEVYSMVESYYRTVHAEHGEEGHQISAGLFSLIKTSRGPLELQTLAASVAAETLIESSFQSIVPRDDTFRDEVKNFLAHVDQDSLSKTFYSRLKGCLDSLLETRNSDLLREFTRRYRLEKRVFESWRYLRNKSAHGGLVPTSKFEETFRKLCDVHYLCYSIVLAFIGYKGPRTNYAQSGFPIETWNPNFASKH